MEVDVHEQARVRAFQALLSKCLLLTDDDELLVIYDESMVPFFPSLEKALADAVIPGTFIYLPRLLQLQLVQTSRLRGSSDKANLPSALVAAITASTAMLNLVDSYANNASVRRAINRTPRRSTCRLATIPGISDEILQVIIDSDINAVFEACEEVAWLLGEAHHAELETHDSAGSLYRLSLSLGGWESEPVMSPGVFLPGSWGNVPPGETFCCPPSETVNGRICINGSIPGRVLTKGEELILEFERGKLLRWSSASGDLDSPTLKFFDNLERQAAIDEDENWNTFAELGFGLNERITSLTGNPLFDEKAAGTLHVAIGDNSIFGDDVWSLIHEDLIVKRPSLELDGERVMTKGVIDKVRLNSRRERIIQDHESMPVADTFLYLREGRIARHRGVPMRRLSKAQRINYVRMADSNVSAALGALCDMLATYDRVHITTFLGAHPSFLGIQSPYLLRILHHYRIVQFDISHF
jgi:leucyl aminopeptidase (aminopeptidase T)